MAAATYVGSSAALSSVGGSSAVVTVPAGTTDGDQMFAMVHWWGGSSLTGLGAWTLIGSGGGKALYKRTASSEPASYTFGTTGGTPIIVGGAISVYRDFGSYGLNDVVTGSFFSNAAQADLTPVYSPSAGTVKRTNHPYVASCLADANALAAPTITQSYMNTRATATATGTTGGTDYGFRLTSYDILEWHGLGELPFITFATDGDYSRGNANLGGIANNETATMTEADLVETGFDEWWDILDSTGCGGEGGPDEDAILGHHTTHEHGGGDEVLGAWALTQDFTSQTTVVFAHGLGGYPRVVVEVGGYEVEADVTHDSTDQVTVRFSSAQTGRIQLS